MKHLTYACIALLAACSSSSNSADSTTTTPPPNAPVNSATYTVTMQIDWNRNQHPKLFPGGAHMSPPIGAVHSDRVSFWQTATLASAGTESMAETGATSGLSQEIQTAITAGTAAARIRANGIGTVPGSSSATFTATREHDRLTIVSMIAPSPDWFVGVDRLKLTDADGNFIDRLEIPLNAYDAGTEDGDTFSLVNPATNPQQPIARLTSPAAANVRYGTLVVEKQ